MLRDTEDERYRAFNVRSQVPRGPHHDRSVAHSDEALVLHAAHRDRGVYHSVVRY
jgi:hypothetical protein